MLYVPLGPPHGDPSHIRADPNTGCQDQRFDVEVEWGNFEHISNALPGVLLLNGAASVGASLWTDRSFAWLVLLAAHWFCSVDEATCPN